MRKIIFLSFLFLSLGTLINAQTVAGKIISGIEAEQLFGKPEYSTEMSSSRLADYVRSSSMLFLYMTQEILVITNEKKEILFPEGYTLTGKELFHVYSSSVVNELLKKNSGDTIFIEMRKNVLTITNGDSTMEFGF